MGTFAEIIKAITTSKNNFTLTPPSAEEFSTFGNKQTILPFGNQSYRKQLARILESQKTKVVKPGKGI